MQTLLIPLFKIIEFVLGLYLWAIAISVVLTWLVAFNVINPRNEVVRVIGSSLHQLLEPALRRIRQVMPMFGALDLSPLVLGLIVLWVQDGLVPWVASLLLR